MHHRTDVVLAQSTGRPVSFRFFWGHRGHGLGDHVLSQWWPCRFTHDGVSYTSAEQWMMAEKARLSGDENTLAQILAEHDPSTIKKLGRRVSPYDDARWVAHRFDAVVAGSVLKFGQNAALRRYLLDTGDDVLVEASPLDTVWGIGLGATSPLARDAKTWRGENLLGFALGRAREKLRDEGG
jgi:hypothetical protein